MLTEAIRLHFNSPLHIGRGATEMDRTGVVYHSDALKSALYAVGLPYYPQWEAAPDAFFNAFRISSALPFCGDELFLPRPYKVMQFSFRDTHEEKEAKKAKRISFISSGLFQKWAQQKEQPLLVQDTQLSPGGTYLFSKTGSAFLHAEVQQRVQVPAEGEGEDARPFYFDRLYFEQDSGLYFLAQFDSEPIRQQVLHALTLLGEQGIGTDRTVGNGQFSFNASAHLSKFELPQVSDGVLRMNLGLYLPTRDELKSINLEESYWQLVKRGGYLAGSSQEKFLSLRKNSIYFFAEGSMFKASCKITGCYANLRPQWNDEDLHPIWRCGQPLFINL